MSRVRREAQTSFRMDRRFFVLGAAAFAAGCGPTARTNEIAMAAAMPPPPDPYYVAMYSGIYDEPYPVPAIDVRGVDPRYLRQIVPYEGSERPGTIVVDPRNHFLHLVMEDARAMRYGVGVGREGFGWSGRASVQRKAEWPVWTPPRSMIRRDPSLEEFANGMEPGLMNPLGARALYLYENGRDTLYRIHGTNEPWSIGQSMSSGCIRLFNHDIIDLYNRTPRGTPVVVRAHGPALSV